MQPTAIPIEDMPITEVMQLTYETAVKTRNSEPTLPKGVEVKIIRTPLYIRVLYNNKTCSIGGMPAYVDVDGAMRWYDMEGYLHREDGPASVSANGTKKFYKHGRIHNDNGPAIIYADGRVKYYREGVEYTPTVSNTPVIDSISTNVIPKIIVMTIIKFTSNYKNIECKFTKNVIWTEKETKFETILGVNGLIMTINCDSDGKDFNGLTDKYIPDIFIRYIELLMQIKKE